LGDFPTVLALDLGLKHYSLFCPIIRDEEKSFVTLTPGRPEHRKAWKCETSADRKRRSVFSNGTVQNVNNCLNTNIYSYLETSGGQSFNLYLNVVHFYNTSVN